MSLSFWVEEKKEAQERQGYSLCDLQKKGHFSKLLLEIFNDRIAI